jgi:hypothetical protein
VSSYGLGIASADTEGISNPRSGGEWTAPNVGTLLRTMERRAEVLG